MPKSPRPARKTLASDSPVGTKAGRPTPILTRASAAGSLTLWVTLIFVHRLIAFQVTA